MKNFIVRLLPLLAVFHLFGGIPSDALSIQINNSDILSEQTLEDINWQPLELFGTLENVDPVFWLELKRKPPYDLSTEQGVFLLSNLFDSIEVFANPHSKPTLAITGKSVDINDKTISKGFYKNAIPLDFRYSETLYIKLTSISSESISKRSLSSLEYLSWNAFEKLSNKTNTIFILFTGMEIFLLLVLSIIIFIKPSKDTIAYVFMVVASLGTVTINNQVFDTIWQVSSVSLDRLLFCLVIIMLYSFSVFNATYLKIHSYSKFWYRVMTLPYILLCIPIYFYKDYYFLNSFNELYFLTTIVGSSLCLIKFRKTNPHRSYIFLIAILPIVLNGLMIIAAWKKIIPHNFWTLNSLFIALFFRDVVFMIDLVYRFFMDQAKVGIKEAQVIQLQKEKNELKKIELLKTNFFNNVSHELRTPLTLLLGPLESVLNNKNTPNSIKDELNMSLKNGKYLLQLTNEILDLSKLDEEKQKINQEKEDVIFILNTVIDSFTNYAVEKGLTLHFSHSTNESILDVDKNKFKKIFINLLSNAIKYSQSTGNISVELKEEYDITKIIVSDTGIGIPEDELTKIFDRYYQVDPSKLSKGTGLGLAIVKRLVYLHNGHIRVTSMVGEGSRFEVNFPKNKAPCTQIQYTDDMIVNEQSINSSKHTILLIEDNVDMQQYLESHLQEYRIYKASNGQEALYLLERFHKLSVYPDLIITDYMMPIMDGSTFTKVIKKHRNYSLTPVIFITARNLQKDKIEMLSLGVDDYIVKPFDMKELKLRINITLKNNRKQKNFISGFNDSFSPSETLEFKKELDIYTVKNIKNKKLNNTDLANFFSLSERSLNRKIKSITGLTPAAYIREVRLQTAKRMIECDERASVSEIAHGLGMNNLSHFTQAYKKRFGKLPSSDS